MRTVSQVLASLTGTYDQVAAKLTELDCKGRRCSETDSPIAILLEREGYRLVEVRKRVVTYYHPRSSNYHTQCCSCFLPKRIREFQQYFNHGHYPKLVWG